MFFLRACCAEIGATAKQPTALTMKKGICMGYVTILGAYLLVSTTGGCCPPLHARSRAALM
jgi:hypothetical protein